MRTPRETFGLEGTGRSWTQVLLDVVSGTLVLTGIAVIVGSAPSGNAIAVWIGSGMILIAAGCWGGEHLVGRSGSQTQTAKPVSIADPHLGQQQQHGATPFGSPPAVETLNSLISGSCVESMQHKMRGHQLEEGVTTADRVTRDLVSTGGVLRPRLDIDTNVSVDDGGMTTSARTHRKPPSTDRLKPGDGLVLGLLMASTFLVLLNEMLLGVALPTLIRDLGITPSAGQWLTTGYLLTLAVLIPATGFIMRRFHLRTIFLTALSIFIVGTAISAIAPGFAVLLVGRIIQAVGTAVFVPLLMTTAIRLVPESRRGRIMALVTAVPAIAPAVGPAISGLVLTFLPWRWLFILVLPLAVIALIAGAMRLKNITTPEQATLDLVSVALSAVGFGALVFGLSLIGESATGHAPVPPAIPIVIGVLGVAGFVFRQLALRRHGDAFLDMRIFRSKSFVVPILVMLFVALNGFGILLVLPLVLTGSLGLSTLLIGLFLVPGGVVISVVSALGGRVYDRYGPLPLAIPGAIIWAASIWFLSTLDNRSSVWIYLAGYLVMTAAQAMMWAPMTTLALSSLRAELYPYGSAAFSTVQQLAGAAGGAVLVSAYTIGSNAANAGELSVAQTVAAGHTAFITAGIIAVAAVIGTLAIGRLRSVAPAPSDVA